MIFNSNRIKKLIKKYENTSPIDLPTLVYLFKNNRLDSEIKYIEKVLKSVSPENANRWVKEFINANDGLHWGSWFEIRLYDWLKQIGKVEIEPEFLGNYPDFKLSTTERDIFIEAKAFLANKEEKRKRRMDYYLHDLLYDIDLPLRISIEEYKHGKKEVDDQILVALRKELPNLNNKPFSFKDKYGNEVKLEIHSNEFGDDTFVAGPSRGFWINTDLLKSPLKEKASQHKALRSSENPYIIALFIESMDFSGQDVVYAWFGKPTVSMNSKNLEVISSGNDLSGLHFGRSKIFHTSVSGTLIFKVGGFSENGERTLSSYYVENPYAKNPISHEIFPVESKYILSQIKENSFHMEWIKD